MIANARFYLRVESARKKMQTVEVRERERVQEGVNDDGDDKTVVKIAQHE